MADAVTKGRRLPITLVPLYLVTWYEPNGLGDWETGKSGCETLDLNKT